MRYIRSFAPRIVFAIVSTFDWRYAALSSLVVAVGLVVGQRRNGSAWDALILESGSALFFAVLTAIAFAAPDSSIKPYVGPISTGWLALIAWVSLGIRRPFTLGIAKQMTERAIWDSPIFRRVNVTITAVWAVVLCAILRHSYSDPGTATTIVQVVCFLIPIVFTVRYPAIVRARYSGRAPA
jgi:uncharacterized membrane protein YgdD (TMEM256/DUF423 family)